MTDWPDSVSGTQKDHTATHTAATAAKTAGLPDWKGNARYDVISRIGSGGMGVVYGAFDRERGRVVALKTVLSTTPESLLRFKQEFRTLADVDHRNLVRLHELVITDEGDVFFTMELVEGIDFLTHVWHPGTRRAERPANPVSLATRRDNGASFSPMHTSEVRPTRPPPDTRWSPADMQALRGSLVQLVEGVQALHSAGKLHRDIKPSNVLVTAEGRVVILDFGVAADLSPRVDEHLAEPDEVVGTFRYMSPEQGLGEALTPASDWYSVGVMLYEALVGKPPFEGSGSDVLTLKALRAPVPPGERVRDIPPELDALCRVLLEVDPERRPAGPEILKRLRGVISVRPQSPLPPANTSTRAEWVGRESQLAALRESFDAACSGRAISVRIAGGSGMGKSALVEHFLDGLVAQRDALVLRGRAYEREAIPYKAFDAVVDCVSRHLVHREMEDDPITLPPDTAALARVFPVLRRVPRIRELAEEAAVDPNLLRRRAFSALRSLLKRVCDRQPVVIYIDDVQWGDADSAALLLELVRPPSAPPVLYLLTHREEEAKTSALLEAIVARWPEQAEMRDIAVGPLSGTEAMSLAVALIGASGALADRMAKAAARESRGSPFLVQELVRHSMHLLEGRPEGSTLEALTLAQMVEQRLERLSESGRRLVEVLAVSGRPMSVALVADAAGVGESIDETLVAARARRFVRTGLSDGIEVVEMAHDAFRENIVAHLAESRLRECHAELARCFESTSGADPEAIARHLLGAGDRSRASVFVERAAEEAIAKLAFDHAARLLRTALETTAGSPEERRRLRTRLATVLEWAGRGEEAARAYFEAAEGAAPIERAELERAASFELLAAGRMVEGAAVLHRVLAALGLSAPRSTLAAIFWLILHRIQLALLARSGFRFVPPAAGARTAFERTRVEAVYSAAYAFKCSDVIVATCMTTRSLLLALRFGERVQVLRAAVVESGQHAAMGGKEGKLERKLAEFAYRLAHDEGTVAARGYADGGHALRLYLRGEWKRSVEVFDGAETEAMHDHQGAGWRADRDVFVCWALNFLGEHRELTKRFAAILDDANQRGDRYTSVQLCDGSLAILRLVDDDPEGARRQIADAMALWPHDRYLLQHWHRLYGEAEIELYVGDGAKAYARVDRDTAALKKSLLLNVQHMRVQTAFLRGRCAIASLDATPEHRAARLGEAKRIAKKLADERMGWSAPFAAILNAAVANANGDRSAAAEALKRSIDLANAAHMAGYVNAATYQLGVLVGGDEGSRLVQRAEDAMKAQGIRAPGRFASTLVPGDWRAPQLS